VSQSDFVSRGQALVAAGQFQEAVKVCRLGLLGRPTTVEGRVVLGQALHALKRYDEVLAEMRVALELDHTSVPAHALKAEALLRKGDTHAAIEALHEARKLAPGDPRILQLLGEAEQGSGKSPSTSHPAVGFVGGGDTKHYPNHADGGPHDPEASEGFTKPTSIAAPGSIRRTSERRAAVVPLHKDPTPSPDVLAVGDKSGTVEVDPELEGVELEDDLDFDDLAAPPISKSSPKPVLPRSGVKVGSHPKGSGTPDAAPASKKLPAPKQAQQQQSVSAKTPTAELSIDDDSDLIEIDETRAAEKRKPGPGTAVRNAVKMPSGPLDVSDERRADARPKPLSPMPLSRAQQPFSMQPQPVPSTPQPLPPAPRVPLAAALPTMAALPPPQGMPSPQQMANAARPTMAIAAPPPPMSMAQQQSAAAVDKLFGAEQPNWARATAGANEPTAQPGQIDPAIQAMLAGAEGAAPVEPMKVAKTGMRKVRSKLQIAMWIVIGIVVIGGGVFAGFQIRAMRLQKQIAAARDRARDLAKNDTWTGWIAARDDLAGIVKASGTIENRAALARARALIAFEFGEGPAEAKPAVEALNGKGGLDGDIAAAYLALAQNDFKSARLAADKALSAAPSDAGANYVAGQAALLAGDAKAAVKLAKEAFDKEARPLYGVGLARAQADAYAWDDAIGSLDRVLSGTAEHPAAVIERGMVLSLAGRITPGAALGNELRGQLEKIVAEGKRPVPEQQHGVSPAQVAFGHLALAQVDFARNELAAAHGDVQSAAAVGLDDQRFAEQAVETLVSLGDLAVAHKLATNALANWPGSRRLRLALAQIALAQGKANDAVEVIKNQPDFANVPLGQAIRGQARLATGDVDGARADFEAALKKLPNLEPALVGRAWLDLTNNDVDEARKKIEPRYSDKGATPALATVYAAILRRSNDPAQRDKARQILEKLVGGAPGPEIARAQLELARVYHDVGDFQSARKAYASASGTGNFEARMESGLLSIEDRDPNGGRETLDALLKESGEHPNPMLVIETARARMLAGDHAGAAQLIETAEKLPGVQKWKVQRERGRLYLRRGDLKAAIIALGSALEGCGDDAETFLLATDAATADDKSALTEKVSKLYTERLKGTPEASIVNGKLLLAAGKNAEAEAAYTSARDRLKNEKAAARRIAQANYGLAVVAYNKANDPDALAKLNLVINDDPSIYDAYLFKADIIHDKKQALEQAQSAVKYNPDYPRAWSVLGKAAAKLNDKAILMDAITKLTAIAPNSDELKELNALRNR